MDPPGILHSIRLCLVGGGQPVGFSATKATDTLRIPLWFIEEDSSGYPPKGLIRVSVFGCCDLFSFARPDRPHPREATDILGNSRVPVAITHDDICPDGLPEGGAEDKGGHRPAAPHRCHVPAPPPRGVGLEGVKRHGGAGRTEGLYKSPFHKPVRIIAVLRCFRHIDEKVVYRPGFPILEPDLLHKPRAAPIEVECVSNRFECGFQFCRFRRVEEQLPPIFVVLGRKNSLAESDEELDQGAVEIGAWGDDGYCRGGCVVSGDLPGGNDVYGIVLRLDRNPSVADQVEDTLHLLPCS